MLSLAANLILALWLARGLFRRWWAGVRGISGATKR
jgi:hypothetical protein